MYKMLELQFVSRCVLLHAEWMVDVSADQPHHLPSSYSVTKYSKTKNLCCNIESNWVGINKIKNVALHLKLQFIYVIGM